MKTLYLLRHAKSSRNDPSLADHDRPLALRGEQAAARIGGFLKEQEARIDLVLCSTATRAAETARRVLAAMEAADTPVEHEHGLYLCGARVLLERLRDAPDSATSLMLVAHNPDLEELSGMLVGTGDEKTRRTMAEKFPTGACAVLLFESARWSDIDLGAARLATFVLPRKLV